MYADQPSGLGAEIVTFDNDYSIDISTQKWFYQLNQWKADGRPTAKPPGVGNADKPLTQGSKKKQDYSLLDDRYLLRPEVGVICGIYRILISRLVIVNDRP